MTQHEKVMIFRHLRRVTTDLHDTAWESDDFSLPTQGHNWPSWHSMRMWWFFVTYAGSQQTFMTQRKKVIIFCHLRGVTTDLPDTAWECDDFLSLMRGQNWPSWHSMRKWWFFVIHAGSQLTIMTQNEKVMIFRHTRGVTTDLLDV